MPGDQEKTGEYRRSHSWARGEWKEDRFPAIVTPRRARFQSVLSDNFLWTLAFAIVSSLASRGSVRSRPASVCRRGDR